MAIAHERVHRMNSSGSYDTVHYETDSSVVLRTSTNATVEDTLARIDTEVNTLQSLTAVSTINKGAYNTFNDLIVGVTNPDIGDTYYINDLNCNVTYCGTNAIGGINNTNWVQSSRTENSYIEKAITNSVMYKRDILSFLPMGNYSIGGLTQNVNVYPTSSASTFGMSKFLYTTRPLIIMKKVVDDNFGITVYAIKYDETTGNYTSIKALSTGGDSGSSWFNTEIKAVSIPANVYFWVGFRDGNNPHQLTMDNIFDYIDFFETSANIGPATIASVTAVGGVTRLSACNINIEYAQRDLFVYSDNFNKGYYISYAFYESSDNYSNTKYTNFSVHQNIIIPAGTYYRINFFIDSTMSEKAPKTYDEILEFREKLKFVEIPDLKVATSEYCKLLLRLYSINRPYAYDGSGLYLLNQGYVSTNGGINHAGTEALYPYRCYASAIGLAHNNAIVYCPAIGYKMGVFSYIGQSASVDTFVENSGWISCEGQPVYALEKCTDPDNKLYIRISFAHTDDTTLMTSDDIAYIRSVLRIYYLPDNSSSIDYIINADKNIEERMQQLNRPYRIPTVGMQTDPLVLLHFSDIHGDTERLTRIINFKQLYSSYIDDILHTGDNVARDCDNDGFSFWDDVSGTENILNCIGNHDTWIEGESWYARKNEAYSTYFEPYINNWNVVHNSTNLYYYKDYTSRNIRLIVLDSMVNLYDEMHNNSTTQITWFRNTLLDAKNNSLDVVVALHAAAFTIGTESTIDKYNGLDTPFDESRYYFKDMAYTSTTAYPRELTKDYIDAVTEFQEYGGNFICWLHGHYHYEIARTYHASDNVPDQLEICVGNAGITRANSRVARVSTTKSADWFNVLAIDTYGKLVKVISLGSTVNYHMGVRDTFCWNYETGEKII